MNVEKPLFNSFGFTLIEVIITLGIIAIITTVGLLNFQRNTSTSTYSLNRDLLSSDLRLMAAKALNAERFQGQEPTSWGAHFTDSSNSYTLFADLDADRTYDPKEQFKTVKLNPDIKIQWQGYPTGDVVFNTGDGKAFVNTLEIPVTSTAHLIINIKDQNNATLKSLSINPLGTVSN